MAGESAGKSFPRCGFPHWWVGGSGLGSGVRVASRQAYKAGEPLTGPVQCAGPANPQRSPPAVSPAILQFVPFPRREGIDGGIAGDSAGEIAVGVAGRVVGGFLRDRWGVLGRSPPFFPVMVVYV